VFVRFRRGAYRAGRSVRRYLLAGGEGEDERRLSVTARILSAGQGLSYEDALERLGESEAEEAEAEG